MPYKKKFRKSKRRYRRKRKQIIPRNPFPQSALRRHRYAEFFSLNPGVAGAVDSYVFSANSVYDPNVSGTGHQPIGYDEMTAMYTHNYTLGSKITVRAYNQNTPGNDAAIVGVKVDSATVVSSNAIDMVERGGGISKMLGTTANTPEATMYKSYSYKKWNRATAKSDENKAISGNTGLGTNPSNRQYFIVWMGAGDNTTDIGTALFQVTIEYIVLWVDPKTLSQS